LIELEFFHPRDISSIQILADIDEPISLSILYATNDTATREISPQAIFGGYEFQD